MASKRLKGQEFEREICKKLSAWITRGQRTDVFWRTAMSGGRATVHNRDSEIIRQGGDISAQSHEGFKLCTAYYFELKFYRDLLWDRFLLERTGPLAEFWTDTVSKASRFKRLPVLIGRQNFHRTMLITPTPLRWPFNVAVPLLHGYHNVNYCVIDFEKMLRHKPGVV